MEKVVNYQEFASGYKGKKVFVTGHTGFKGAWLTSWLHKLGAIVKGYALAPEHEQGLFNLQPSLQLSSSVIADIRNKSTLIEAVLSFQPDFIFHLAAQPLVRKSYQIPAETFEVNAIGTANLLEAVQQLPGKCQVIIVTTDKVYENRELDILYKEDDILGGYDPYSASKACTEILVSSFRNSFFNIKTYNTHQKAIASARAGNVIGGGDFCEDRIIPDIVRALKSGTEIEVRNPSSMRPWQHVLEPLGGYLLLGILLEKDPNQFSQAFNFGPKPGDHLSVGALVNAAVKHWGSGQWKDTGNKNAPHEAGLLKLDISKARKVLGWTPKLSANEAMGWTLDWYKKKPANAFAFTLQQIENYMQL